MTGAPDCPFCGAGAVERVSQWGGQIITAQWRCEACNSYFEAIREEFDDPSPLDPRDDVTRVPAGEQSAPTIRDITSARR